MAIGKNVLQGSSVSKNTLPAMPSKPSLLFKGEYNGRKATFGLAEDVISKHMMLVGG